MIAPAEAQLESRPTDRGVVDGDRGAVSLGDVADDREAEARTTVAPVPRFVGPGEAVEDVPARRRGDAGSVVVDEEPRTTIGGRSDGHLDHGVGVAGGVVDQIHHGTTEQVVATDHPMRMIDGDTHRDSARPCRRLDRGAARRPTPVLAAREA